MEGLAFYGVFAAIISCLVGVVAYFADKWLSRVDDSIKAVSDDLIDIKIKISKLDDTILNFKGDSLDSGIDVKDLLNKVDARITFQSQKLDVLNSQIIRTEKSMADYGDLIKAIVKKISK